MRSLLSLQKQKQKIMLKSYAITCKHWSHCLINILLCYLLSYVMQCTFSIM